MAMGKGNGKGPEGSTRKGKERPGNKIKGDGSAARRNTLSEAQAVTDFQNT